MTRELPDETTVEVPQEVSVKTMTNEPEVQTEREPSVSRKSAEENIE